MTLAATWTSTHVYGECLAHHEKKLLFVKIPKCASSWCDDFLARMGNLDQKNIWQGANFQDPALKNYQILTVLRDPIDRWISVAPAKDKINTWSSEQEIQEELYDLLPLYIKDEHLAPQHGFLIGADISNAMCFEFGPELSRDFVDFFHAKGMKTPFCGDPINQGKRSFAREFWRQILLRETFRQRLREIYGQDYDLLHHVKFWRAS
jgi:hypothetical protein